VLDALDRRASEGASSRNALAERYLAEGVRMDGHPEIRFRDGALGRRAALGGTARRLAGDRDAAEPRQRPGGDGSLSRPSAREGAGGAVLRSYAAYEEEVEAVAQRERAAAEPRPAEDALLDSFHWLQPVKP
jgi:hypothetical protein